MDYNSFDLIIASNNVKKSILMSASENKQFLKPKVMTYKELKYNLYGEIKPLGYKAIIKEFNLSLSLADKYFENAYYIDSIWQYLKNNNYIRVNKNFKSKYHNILVIDTFIDKYVLDDLKNANITYDEKTNTYQTSIYEFRSLDEELEFIGSQIAKLLKIIPIDKIKLVNITDDMKETAKRCFNMMNIPLDIEDRIPITQLPFVVEFLKQVTKVSLEEALLCLNDPDIKNIIIDLINSYGLSMLDDLDLKILKHQLRKIKCSIDHYRNVINVVDIDDIIDDGSYYFIVGLNEGVLPKTVKNEDFFSDERKIELGINDSTSINRFNEKLLISKLTHYPNVIATYHLKTLFNQYEPSHIIDKIGLEVKKDNQLSNDFNDLNIYKYAKKMDRLSKYNEKESDLEDFHQTYKDCDYNTYDNSFKGINNDKLYEYLDNKLILSYSSIDNYFHCAFRYYIHNILKLDGKEESLALTIGSLFHWCLSKMYDKDFNLDKEYADYLKDKTFKVDEQYFINKLKHDLEFVINTIRYQDGYSLLNKTLSEKKIFVDISKRIKITFMGFVDKIKYLDDEDGKTIAIIDYKTGNLETNIDNMNYGFHLQLPVYIYLANHEFKNVSLAGFYLQKIVNPDIVDEEETDRVNKLKLDGFTNSDLEIASKLDQSCEHSNIIQSLRMKQNKEWYAYSKVLSNDDIKTITEETEKLILDARDSIIDANFAINPKRIDNDLVGCEYCKFKDICYRKEEDIVNLKSKKIFEILGGEKNA